MFDWVQMYFCHIRQRKANHRTTFREGMYVDLKHWATLEEDLKTES